MFCLYFSEANHPISIKFGEQMSKVYSEYGDVDKKIKIVEKDHIKMVVGLYIGTRYTAGFIRCHS